MNELDRKINTHFPGVVVRKDLVKEVKGNAIVPSYVLEYLLGQYCATSDEASIQSGIETVKEILRKHYVHRNEAGLIRSTIRERGRHKVIDKISVALNEKRDQYEATFSNLGIRQVLMDADTVRRHPKMLVNGVWCIADIEYHYYEDGDISPWVMTSIKSIQLSRFDFEAYVGARREFTTDEWIDLLMQSIGFDPQFFGRRNKLMQLIRLIPYCERNYNLIELGPKGTGKSHIYSEFSPHGILISGGEVTVAKLFVNNATRQIGLVGYWDTVAFDEFAGKKKRADKALVDILKNYMANKSFSRGIETLGAEASMVFVGNTQHTLPYMLRHSDLFDELPIQYHDSAFLDRLHFYIPGWEVDIIRGEMFSDGYGFVVDYLAEILRNLRTRDYAPLYQQYFELLEDISTRDRTSILKTFSGLMKILYPHQEASAEEVEELLGLAIEGRKRVKDQLLRIDSTYTPVRFGYKDAVGDIYEIETLEESLYPKIYHSRIKRSVDVEDEPEEETAEAVQPAAEEEAESDLKMGHVTIKENQKGISFENLFGRYLEGATKIVLTDPYIRIYYQIRNLMEFLAVVAKYKAADEEVKVHLVTVANEFDQVEQTDFFIKMQSNLAKEGIRFSWELANPRAIHARHIVTDHGWKISLDRGLDVFQRFDVHDPFELANQLQEYRACKPFEVTYLRLES